MWVFSDSHLTHFIILKSRILLFSIGYFSIAVIECSDQSNLRKEGFTLAYSSSVQYIMVEKA